MRHAKEIQGPIERSPNGQSWENWARRIGWQLKVWNKESGVHTDMSKWLNT